MTDLRRLGSAVHDLAWVLRHAEPDSDVYEPLPPTEFQVVRYLDRHPGAAVGEVARALGLRQSNASTAVRGLIERGLVERHPDAEDRRVVRLTTTPRSALRRDPVEQSWAQALESALSEMNSADSAAVRAAIGPLERLVERLS